MNDGGEPAKKQKIGAPTVVACVVFQTRDPEQLVQLLREALTGIHNESKTINSAKIRGKCHDSCCTC